MQIVKSTNCFLANADRTLKGAHKLAETQFAVTEAHFAFVSASIKCKHIDRSSTCIIGSFCKGPSGPVVQAQRLLVKAILAVPIIIEPYLRSPLLGFYSIVALLTIKHDRISSLLMAPKAAGAKLSTGSTRQGGAESLAQGTMAQIVMFLKN